MPHTLLSSHVLGLHRARAVEAMIHRCVVQHAVNTTLPGGRVTSQFVDSLSAAARSLLTLLLGREEQETLRAGRRDIGTLYRVVLPAGTAVSAESRLIVSGSTDTGRRPVAWTKTLMVEAIEPPDHAHEVTRRVLATEVLVI